MTASIGTYRSGLRRRSSHGFTLIEVLATILVVGIVLPVAMGGISNALWVASNAKHQVEAASLADAKLGELLATGLWQNGAMGGDFAPDWPNYRWQARVINRDENLLELDLKVTWMTARNEERAVSLATLIYQSTATQQQ